MNDNEWWYFTFGAGHEHAGTYVRIQGSYNSARDKMFEKYGSKWAFQYPESEWKKMVNNKHRLYSLETELEVIPNVDN